MPGQDCRAGAGSDPKARYVNPDSGTRPPVETKRGRAARSPLAPEDGRHPELTRNLYSAHRWASKAKRPAWGTPVPVFRFLVPSRRAPGTVHNSPGMEIQFFTELNLWVKPQHNPKQKARGLALGLAPKTPVPAHNRGKSGPKPRSKSKGGYPEGSFCPSSGSLTRFLQGPETRMRPPGSSARGDGYGKMVEQPEEPDAPPQAAEGDGGDIGEKGPTPNKNCTNDESSPDTGLSQKRLQ